MGRLLGIPTRMVNGFSHGHLDASATSGSSMAAMPIAGYRLTSRPLAGLTSTRPPASLYKTRKIHGPPRPCQRRPNPFPQKLRSAKSMALPPPPRQPRHKTILRHGRNYGVSAGNALFRSPRLALLILLVICATGGAASIPIARLLPEHSGVYAVSLAG